ncbi:DMP19 family protein [Acidovorax sp. LjRoot117]|uniref:DMP19 family protein n=1 Tax=Acidovorax sp. LjRoot117 TaxID=3342255 RepID=UPI003ECCF0DC
MDDLDYVLERIDPWVSKFISSGTTDMTPLQVVGVGVWLLEAKVNNGGFDQYYSNSAGALAVPTVSALEAIGASNTAHLLAAANAEFPHAMPPVDREKRRQALDSVRETARFGALEREFYQDQEHRVSLLASYLRAHVLDA